jgi:hypothetical protein
MEALKGDVKVLESFCAAANWRKRLKEKSFVDATSFCSAAVSERGRASMAWGVVPAGPGSVVPPQAVDRRRAAAAAVLLYVVRMTDAG